MIKYYPDHETDISQTNELQQGNWQQRMFVHVVRQDKGVQVLNVACTPYLQIPPGELLVPELHNGTNDYLTAEELDELAKGPQVSCDEPGWD